MINEKETYHGTEQPVNIHVYGNSFRGRKAVAYKIGEDCNQESESTGDKKEAPQNLLDTPKMEGMNLLRLIHK